MSDDDAKKDEDVALVCAATDDGAALGVIRKRGESLEAAILEKAEEGRPIHGELLRLSRREESNLYDVQVLHDARARERSGPANVASDAYRKGWDRLFSRKRRAGDGAAN